MSETTVNERDAGASPAERVVVRDGRDAARANGRDGGAGEARRGGAGGGIDPLFGVRTADIEPYTGLGYLSKLFRMIAVVLVLLLIAEVVTGFMQQGSDALVTLLAEASRLIVLAGLLWGAGDLAILLIDVGHDVRAARILLGRQAAHQTPAAPHGPDAHTRIADRASAAGPAGSTTAREAARP